MNDLRGQSISPWILAGTLAVVLNWPGTVLASFVYPVFALPAARCAGFFFNAAPFFDDQGSIVIPLADAVLEITPDCSAYGFFCLMTALLFVFFRRISRPLNPLGKTILIPCASYLITVISNSFRIVSGYHLHALVAQFLPKAMRNIIHLGLGITVFLTVLFCVYLILERKECYGRSRE